MHHFSPWLKLISDIVSSVGIPHFFSDMLTRSLIIFNRIITAYGSWNTHYQLLSALYSIFRAICKLFSGSHKVSFFHTFLYFLNPLITNTGLLMTVLLWCVLSMEQPSVKRHWKLIRCKSVKAYICHLFQCCLHNFLSECKLPLIFKFPSYIYIYITSHYLECGLVGNDILQSGRFLPTFQSNFIPWWQRQQIPPKCLQPPTWCHNPKSESSWQWEPRVLLITAFSSPQTYSSWPWLEIRIFNYLFYPQSSKFLAASSRRHSGQSSKLHIMGQVSI